MAGAFLVVAVMWVASSAGNGDPCLPRVPASLEAATLAAGLQEDQRLWLSDMLSTGRLDHPDDLWGCPEVDATLVAALRDVFCWGTPQRMDVESLWSTAGNHREWRLRGERGSHWGVVRFKTRDWRRSQSGGAHWQGNTLSLSAGTIRGAWGLGLLPVLGRADPRGRAPLRMSPERWALTTGTGAETGGVFRWAGLGVELWGTRAFKPSRGFQGGVVRSGDGGKVGVLAGRFPRGSGGSLVYATKRGGGALGAEAAYREWDGWSWGASWNATQGPWRLQGSLVREPRDDGPRSDLRWQLRRRLPQGIIRGAFDLRRDEDGAQDTRQGGELEITWRVSRGWRVVTLWRREERRSLEPGDEFLGVVRHSVEWREGPWSLLIRAQEHTSGEGSSFTGELRGGGRWHGLRLELRARERSLRGHDPPAVYGYRRRPGALFDLERIPPGAAWGVWMEARLSTLAVEISADRGSVGTEVSGAVHFWWEGID